MPSLLDIAPRLAKKQVDIAGTKIDVQAVGAEVWAQLYAAHPLLATIVQGELDTLPTEQRRPMTVLRAQAALIAAGTGHLLEPEHEEAAFATLTAEEQGMLVSAIIDISMPGQMFLPLEGPAVVALLVAAAGSDGQNTKAPATR